MKSCARSGSTAFQVCPSYFNAEPTTQPSTSRKISPTVSCLTPVLANTGVIGNTFLTASMSLIAAASPVMAPDTSTASGIEENTADRARSGKDRRSRLSANSAETLYSIARSRRPSRPR